MPDPRIPMDGTWLTIKKIIREQIEKGRETLETPFLTEEQTAHERGGIAKLRELIRLVEPDAPEANAGYQNYSTVRAGAED